MSRERDGSSVRGPAGLVVPVHDAPAEHRHDRPSREPPSHVGAVARTRAQPRERKGLLDARIDDREVAVVAGRDAALAARARTPRPAPRGVTRATSSSESHPSRTATSSSGRIVCTPGIPDGLFGYGRAFSASVCGAWSLPMQAIVPSASASRSASRWRASRTGGFICDEAAPPRVALGRGEEEVVGRDLRGHEVAEVDARGGAPPPRPWTGAARGRAARCARRGRAGAASRAARSRRRARRGGRTTGAPSASRGEPDPEPRLVLGVDRDAPRPERSTRSIVGSSGTSSVARGRAHEDLDAGAAPAAAPTHRAARRSRPWRRGRTRGRPARGPPRAVQLVRERAPGSVVGGFVLGISMNAVTPPADRGTASRSRGPPCARAPGSRKCTCGSMRPGNTSFPRASRTVSPSRATRPGDTDSIRPPTIRTSARTTPADETTRPPSTRTSLSSAFTVASRPRGPWPSASPPSTREGAGPWPPTLPAPRPRATRSREETTRTRPRPRPLRDVGGRWGHDGPPTSRSRPRPRTDEEPPWRFASSSPTSTCSLA